MWHMNENSSDAKQVLTKSINRELVRKALGSEKTLTQEVKSAIRENRKNFPPEQIAKDIVEKPFLPDPASVELFNSITETLQMKYPFLKAIILKGSSALGGMFIRRAVNPNSSYRTDGDISLIVDQEINNDTQDEVYKSIDEELQRLKAQKSKLLETFPANYQIETGEVMKNLDSVDDALAVLKMGFAPDVLLYLEPTCPPEINQKNTQLILEAFRTLPKDQADALKVRVLSIYRLMGRVKEKHFDSAYYLDKDIDLVHQQRSDEFTLQLTQALAKLLEFDYGK